ncbi:hypothetical protein Tco_1412941, partial [Tanacetum coccineum]
TSIGTQRVEELAVKQSTQLIPTALFIPKALYVRPGATPIPGAAPQATEGSSGQVRPPATMPPFVVRGPGDWRPGAMRKNFYSGQGIPGWGTGAPRGQDCTPPSHK